MWTVAVWAVRMVSRSHGGAHGEQLPEEYLETVKDTHQTGGNTGSKGYRNEWKQASAPGCSRKARVPLRFIQRAVRCIVAGGSAQEPAAHTHDGYLISDALSRGK